MNTRLKTPVAFIIFNRPNCTQKVFAEIRKARPEKLYLIADAPRNTRPDEAEKCAETRRLVEEMIDWPCEVHKNYADKNMGCRKRIVSGIGWVFEHEEEVIILEDDIVPDPTFFPYCSAMLEKYRNDARVMLVAGFNELNYQPRNGNSFFFSKHPPIWGWATWRRFWILYQPELLNWDVDKETLRRQSYTQQEASLLISRLKMVEAGRLDTWDFHLKAAILINDGLCVIPSKNLIRNIGFGAGATHTISPFNSNRFKQRNALPAPYKMPTQIAVEIKHDCILQRRRTLSHRIEQLKDKILHLLPAPK
jgi:hypothetical protein